ncbi:MAG: uncharacterized protein A8A55_1744 [Amphiamblys sp. WSBS2006]|nr:MAG: uncharacterized protein A8A55_1744 [Amphiamblys sp. WSBS2006]
MQTRGLFLRKRAVSERFFGFLLNNVLSLSIVLVEHEHTKTQNATTKRTVRNACDRKFPARQKSKTEETACIREGRKEIEAGGETAISTSGKRQANKNTRT